MVTPTPHPTPSLPLPPAWFAEPAEDAIRRLESDAASGLTLAAAADRLATFGPNRLAEPERRARWRLFLDQFRNVLVVLLVVGVVVAAVIGDLKDSIAIAVVLVLNATVGYIQEKRAAASLAELREMLALRVRARREGRVIDVAADELVPGDVVLLDAGDRVPADGRIIEAWSACVDESSLTGESSPVDKVVDQPVRNDAPVGDRVTAVFMNTQVTKGRLVIVVTATGMSTEIGQVADLLAGGDSSPTPLQVQLDQLGKRLAVISGVVVGLYFALGAIRGFVVTDLLVSSVALIVAAIPEGLPAVVTLTLALGTRRLAQGGAIVKRLASVETLGSTTMICSDKTGTLTMNQMTCRAVVVDGRRLEVTGHGYDAAGEIVGADRVAPSLLERLGSAAALCNDSHVSAGEVLGDPTEGALVVLAEKIGVDVEATRAASPRHAEIPFDSSRKYMSTFHLDEGRPDHLIQATKGAWEVIVSLCGFVATADGERRLTDDDRDHLASVAGEMAAEGLRVLALATRDLSVGAFDSTEDHVFPIPRLVDGLTLVGLVGLVDPPRPEAIGAIERCRAAGIAVTMITGDHADTAEAIAGQVGITGRVIEGRRLDSIDDDALPAALDGVGVVARISPQHKVRVVLALKRLGHVVAMTGDGVNDAPALVAADIGVAMGSSGTAVARESADMVLVDDNFATITRAVEEGRAIYDNIVKFVRFQVATNIGALTTFIVAQMIGLPRPFNPIQILWINLIMDGPPAVALGVDPTAPDAMTRPPRVRAAPILTRRRLGRVALSGALMAGGTLGVLIVTRARSGQEVALTAAFTTFVLFQIANALNVRDEHRTIFTPALFTNHLMWAALTGVLVLQTLAIYLPVAQRLFHTTAMSPTDWVPPIIAASTVIVAEELLKRRATARSDNPR